MLTCLPSTISIYIQITPFHHRLSLSVFLLRLLLLASCFKNNQDSLFLSYVPLQPLNLPLTKTPEFLKKIEAIMKQDYPCPHQQKCPDFTENTKTLTPPEATKTLQKPKAINFPISKITIGQWTRVMIYPEDLKAKFYFAKKKLIWEILDDVERGTPVAKLNKKIEIQWADVLSFRATFHSHDETGTLEIELGKRPTFFVEANPLTGRFTQWKEMDQDFTLDQSASRCRRHTLHFSPGVLQKILEKLVSGDSFWSTLTKVTFPTLPHSLYFEIGRGNSNNNNSNDSSPNGHGQTLRFRHPHGFGHLQVGEANFDTATQFCANNSNNSSGYGHGQTLSFNANNNDLLHHHPQGFGHVPTQSWANNGRQMNSFVQDYCQNKTMNQLPEAQVIQQSSQLINRGRYFSGSQFNNPMIQDERQMRNTGRLRGSQAYAQPLLETPTNSTIYPIGPYLRGVLAQEGETPNTGGLRGSQAYAQPLLEPPPNSMIYPIGPYLQGVLAQAGEPPNTRELRGTQTSSQLLETQSIPPSFQLINEPYSRGGGFPEPQVDNRLFHFQGRSQMRNEFLGTQTNLMTGYGNSNNNNSNFQASTNEQTLNNDLRREERES